MAITRIVEIRFDARHDVDAASVAQVARGIFPTIPGVLGFEALLPVDGGWDLVLLVRFADLQTVETYRLHPIHVAFVETHVKPFLGESVARNYSQ